MWRDTHPTRIGRDHYWIALMEVQDRQQAILATRGFDPERQRENNRLAAKSSQLLARFRDAAPIPTPNQTEAA